MRFERMSEPLIGSDSVPVLAADPFALDDSTGLKIGDDPLHSPLSDADLRRHLSERERRASREEQQDVRMIRQKRPMGASRFRRR